MTAPEEMIVVSLRGRMERIVHLDGAHDINEVQERNGSHNLAPSDRFRPVATDPRPSEVLSAVFYWVQSWLASRSQKIYGAQGEVFRPKWELTSGP